MLWKAKQGGGDRSSSPSKGSCVFRGKAGVENGFGKEDEFARINSSSSPLQKCLNFVMEKFSCRVKVVDEFEEESSKYVVGKSYRESIQEFQDDGFCQPDELVALIVIMK